jgi:hypothetical protein
MPKPEEDWLKSTRITPRAEKGTEALPAAERESVIATLRQPFRQDRTAKMRQRRDIDLWRVRVTRDVRLTYRRQEGQPLILHVGRHADADSFVTHYEAKNETSHSLEDSPLMKPLHANELLARSNGKPAQSSAALMAHGDQLLLAISTVVRHFIGTEVENGCQLAVEEVERLGSQVQQQDEQAGQLAVAQQRLTAQVDRVAQRQDSLEDRLARLEEQAGALPGRIAGIHQSVMEVRSEQQATQRTIGPMQDDLVRLRADLERLRGQQQTQTDEQGKRLGKLEADVTAAVSSGAATRRAMSELRAQMDDYAVQLDAVALMLARLREQVEVFDKVLRARTRPIWPVRVLRGVCGWFSRRAA